MHLSKFKISNYRSIRKMSIDFDKNPLVICWANNVGKTNFLRALNLFFNFDKQIFDPKQDIPYDIEDWTAWWGRRVQLIWTVISGTDKYEITIEFKKNKKEWIHYHITGKSNKKNMDTKEIEKILKQFTYIFIEASNVNLPELIADIVNDDVLPILDTKRSKQSNALTLLNQFLDKSKDAVEDISKSINQHLSDFVDIAWIDTKDWAIKILFPEFNKLREAIAGMIDFTLYDKSSRKIETKWSWIQRIILFSLIKYIVKRADENTILAIDEPEAFLQPSLQKQVYKVIKELSKKAKIIFTTHSPNLIDIKDLSNVILFNIDSEKRPIQRKWGELFYKINTYKEESSGFEKVQKIKTQLWIMRNDSWEVLPFNVIVEWESDKLMLSSLFDLFGIEIPNILFSWGSTKIKGYLQFLQEFCQDLNFKPKIISIFDHDIEGKSSYTAIDSKTYASFDLIPIYIERYDHSWNIRNEYIYELEDFIYPDILIKSVNLILKQKKYKTVNLENIIKLRGQSAYTDKGILNLITQQVAMKNPGKISLNFEWEQMKLYLDIKITEQLKKIDTTEFDKLNKKYPNVKMFIEKLK